MKKAFGVFATALLFGLFIYSVRYLPVSGDNAKTPASESGQIVSGSLTNIPSKPQALSVELNRVRKLNDSPELIEDSRLIELARLRANDMKVNQYYSHESKDGSYFYDYLEQVGLRSALPSCEDLLLENTRSVSEIVSEWMASPKHKDCLLNSNYTRVGTATVVFDANPQQDDEDTVLSVAIFSAAR